MRVHFLFPVLATLITFTSFLSSQSIPFDTVSIEYTSGGMRYLHLVTELPQQIHIAEIPIKNHDLSFESIRHNGLVTTSRIVSERKKKNEEVIAAVNGDFFSFTDFMPVNNQAEHGRPVTGFTTPKKSAWAVLADGRMIFDGFTFSGSIITKTKKTFPFERLNRERTRSEITLYTRYRGERTRTDSGGVEIVLQPLDTKNTLGSPAQFLVLSAGTAVNSAIPMNGAVISFGRSDTASAFLKEFSADDTISITMNYLPVNEKISSPVLQLLSGWGRLLRNGVNLPALADTNEGLTAKFTAVRHPRTFVGFNADTSKLILGVVDGRQAQSVGMTFLEMSNFLQAFGVTNAINLDGGGSSVLVIEGRAVNVPSDPSGERPVANSLQVIIRNE